ncbi:hypothetical protein CBF34_03555 [Vagococcus penaei]|uniref:Uncharacterized protein n=1 Tax=Vagococcus penaei TaxID=633807 RepID=A0A1Q2D7L3_9ENTE|nr:MBL fold metallo-hydrolase [Vagococcus penaei]AQP54273.1 hypothetical protein BW732_08575 [Vagococcus penaei]RSU05842.1 hypothetical protein CBF34_03555 [Vagococcus penaei]
MNVTVLGYWGGFPYKNDGTTSYLIESDGFSLLLDAGSSTLIQLEKVLDPSTLDAVIISHYHHDHIADLGVLQYYRQLMPKTALPELPIYGHTLDDWHFSQLTMPGISKGIGYHEDDTLEVGPFSITFIKTVHPVVCYAMRIVEKATGKIFVFTGDTGYFDELSAFCQDADLLITDTYFLEGHEHHPAHLTSKETGLIAKEANVKHLVLSHLRQDIDLELLKQQTCDYLANEQVDVQLAKTHLKISL